ncbi:hypothetical protein GYH30_049459 [Glycine max]|nr:hypothetical protein GYH30_049459 [Glycine max]
MLTVIDNRWISTQLLFCLMDDAFELSRLQMSWKWRTRMRLMPCFTRPEVMLFEGCDSPLSLHYK